MFRASLRSILAAKNRYEFRFAHSFEIFGICSEGICHKNAAFDKQHKQFRIAIYQSTNSLLFQRNLIYCVWIFHGKLTQVQRHFMDGFKGVFQCCFAYTKQILLNLLRYWVLGCWVGSRNLRKDGQDCQQGCDDDYRAHCVPPSALALGPARPRLASGRCTHPAKCGGPAYSPAPGSYPDDSRGCSIQRAARQGAPLDVCERKPALRPAGESTEKMT